jgi:hypothetical protein
MDTIHKILTLSSNRSHEVLNIYNNVLKKPEYINELCCYDMLTRATVDIDSSSINHILLEENRNNIGNVLIICDDYYSRNCKYHARNTSILPKKPMLDQLLVLIFTPIATFNTTKDKKGFYSFRTTETDTYVNFTHLFSSEDLRNINKIRNYLNQLITYNGENKQALSEDMRTCLLRIINKSRRIKILSNENWFRMFKIYLNQDKPVVESSYDYIDENYTLGFLPKLNAPAIKEDMRVFTPEGIKELEEERKDFYRMRELYLKDIENIKKIIDSVNGNIVCGCCGCHITSINCIEQKCELFKITSYTGYIKSIPESSDIVDNYVDRFKYNKGKIPEFWTHCPEKRTIFGFKEDSYCFLTKDSPVVVHYPMCPKPIPWDAEPYMDGFKEVRKLVDIGLKEREMWLRKNMVCHLCNSTRFANQEDFFKHLKDEIHLYNLNELMEEEFLEPEYNI